MSAKVFFYCLKVWLASVLIGPALFWGCLRLEQSMGGAYTFTDFLVYWAYTILIGLVYSTISFLVFLLSMVFIYRRHWTLAQLRIATAVLGIVLTTAPFMIFFRTNGFFDPETRTAFLSCYLLPILAGIFYYRYPRPAKR